MTDVFEKNYNVADSYKAYKEQLDSYASSSDKLLIPGCNDFSNQHINGSRYDAPTVCAIGLKFLIHLKEKYDHLYEEDGCEYLYHWLYDSALGRKKSFENTLDLYKELNKIFNNDNDGNNVFDKYINKMNKYRCDKIPKIIHLYEEFNKFENEGKSQGAEKKCISTCVELFNSYVNECQEAYDYDFCNKLKIFGEQYNFFIQRVRKCEGEEYLLPPVEKLDAVNIIIIPFSLMFLTSFILPLLYKFTAFGTWLRRLIGKNENILKYINEEANHSLNTYETVNEDSKIRNYNIAYNTS
ncbi:PIR Superfamily Protein [Plasmodium ovale curtisi]|uniref:PIR Superfamily Protein n=1 Tax=Plasmodium ovale curtisi TaxID=864141 RepID=A0A1A8X8S7_PLAOA|nr:PIR Superfamily Protein [Plasmodium ovale curtisi]